MKSLFIVALMFVGSVSFAGPQQEKMKVCNQQATGKKGAERQAFMKQCLSSTGAPAVAPIVAGPATSSMSPQERMKACNKQAQGKKGPERQKFMSECLKAK
jgi:hypothetical protein